MSLRAGGVDTASGSLPDRLPRLWAMYAYIQLYTPIYTYIHLLNLATKMDFSLNTDIATLRDAPLPKLMSGEVRVGDAGRFVKESVP